MEKIKMKYRNNPVKDATTVELLFEIIKREGKDDAPIKTERYTPHYETIVGIGPNNIASIVLDEDDYSELEFIIAGGYE